MPGPNPAFVSFRRSMSERARAFFYRYSNFSSSVLIDTTAQIGSYDNETTADTKTSAGHSIKVSFLIPDPPGVSCCLVDCPDGHVSAPPLVIGADGDFVLIRVIFPDPDDRTAAFTDVFLYKSGSSPSLRRLARPYPVCLLSDHVGVYSSRGHCSIVIPEPGFGDGGRMRYDLHVFSTKTNSWSIKVARVSSGLKRHYDTLIQHETSKVFSTRRGWLCWVDLRRGILQCDVVGNDPVMYLIELPPLMPTNYPQYGVSFNGRMFDLRPIRDVNCSNDGWIRFIEIEYPEQLKNPPDFQWTVTMYKTTIFSEKWEKSCYRHLYPEIWNYRKNKLSNVPAASPILDIYHDNVVYMMTKLDSCNPYGWMLAVDTRNMKLEKVMPFSSERFYFGQNFIQCTFSKYLSRPPGGQ